MTTTLVCPVCHKNNAWKNNTYKQGMIFICAACSARLQQIFCPHCSTSNTWPNPKVSVEGAPIHCVSCSKSFQFVCCPHCWGVNMWSEANYEQGLVYKCFNCTRPFQHVNCVHCSESNVYSTAATIQGERLVCRSCSKMHQYIRCPHCQKGQAWKDCNYVPGSVVPCWSCKQSFAYMRCPYCEKANYWNNPLNTTISLVCYGCKKNMSDTTDHPRPLTREKSDVKHSRASLPAVPQDQVRKDLAALDLKDKKEQPRSASRHRDNARSSHSRKNISCNYYKECKEYVKELAWSLSFFDIKHDRCYCPRCYSERSSDTLCVAGADYVIPRGWAGFGLGVDPFRAEKIWDTWIVVYHGTTSIAAESILTHRQFLLPGDRLINGQALNIRPGHIPGKVHIYTSPSIRYSSLEVYSPINSFTSPKTGTHYNAQIVLQCKQKPGTYSTQAETVGWGTKPICNIITNDRIEHYTDRRSSVLPYRLLIRLQEV